MAASTWRGRIAFGMVSIPVRLYKAARRERIRFHNVYRPDAVERAEPEPQPRGGPRLVEPQPEPEFEPHGIANAAFEAAPVARVRSMPMTLPSEYGSAPAPVPKEQILKAYEVEKDRYVTFEPEEIAALRPRTSPELAITEFVKLNEIDPVFFEESYYVEPESGAEKPYALLFRALVDSGYASIGELAMHGREHIAVIRPGRRGLILHTLYNANEVRSNSEYVVDEALVSGKERELATMLVNALAAPFEPAKLKSGQEERLRALIESRSAKAVSGKQGAASAPPAPVADIMEALRKSLAAARKPAARETRSEPPRAQPARRSRKK